MPLKPPGWRKTAGQEPPDTSTTSHTHAPAPIAFLQIILLFFFTSKHILGVILHLILSHGYIVSPEFIDPDSCSGHIAVFFFLKLQAKRQVGPPLPPPSSSVWRGTSFRRPLPALGQVNSRPVSCDAACNSGPLHQDLTHLVWHSDG